MKWFLRIFCLYVFALSCLPCSDGEHRHDARSGSSETATLSEKHDCPTHEHCNDFCSPLCTCNCCGCSTSFDKLATLTMTAPVTKHRQPTFAYRAPFSTEHLTALLRPPIYTLG